MTSTWGKDSFQHQSLDDGVHEEKAQSCCNLQEDRNLNSIFLTRDHDREKQVLHLRQFAIKKFRQIEPLSGRNQTS